MAHIPYDHRAQLDESIEVFNKVLAADEDINYAFTKILNHHYGGGGYDKLNKALGVLTMTAIEFYNKRVIPFEKLFKEGEK